MKKIKRLLILFFLPLTFLYGCNLSDADNLQSLTHPYINQYRCEKATLGNQDLLKDISYLTIILKDGGKAEILLKEKGKPQKRYYGNYNFDEESQKLGLSFGIFGYKFKESVLIENGKFSISVKIGENLLFMLFSTE